MQGVAGVLIIAIWAFRLHNEGTWKKFFGAMAGDYDIQESQ